MEDDKGHVIGVVLDYAVGKVGGIPETAVMDRLERMEKGMCVLQFQT